MAKLLDDEITRVSFPITKFEEDSDGNLIVEGVVTDGSVDTDEQIVDPAFSAKALTEWMESGPNLRVMHSPHLLPAGRGLKVELGDFSHTLKALVVEDTAKKLVKNRVLRAYSVGIARPVIERDITGKARGGVIKGGELCEVSLVDRPANRSCQLTLAKSEENEVPWTYGDLDGMLTAAEVAKSAGADLAKAWRQARQQWLDEEPDPANATQGPEYLAKRAEWQRWHATGEANGLLEDGFDTWVAKRDFDPNTGGGVDRDKLKTGDFVFGDERAFPVVTPGDVSDAVSSWGRYRGNKSFADFKKSLIALAKRKGDEFIKELPEAWGVSTGKVAKAAQKDDDMDADTDTESPSGEADDEAAEEDQETADDKANKGMKDCPNCGTGYDADSKKRRCESCGNKLPKANKKAKANKCADCGCGQACSDCTCDGCGCASHAVKGGGMITCSKCDMDADNGASFCPNCGSSLKADKAPYSKQPGETVQCAECHKYNMPDAKFCDQCGAKLGGATKRAVPVPPNKDVEPAGEHREPDGSSTVEQLEQDADMSTTRDAKPDKVPASVKSDAPYEVVRMHDATCAAFHMDDVISAYPALKSVADAIDVDYFMAQVPDIAAKGDVDEVMAITEVMRYAQALKSDSSAAVLADARAELHKSFTDMYPNTRVTPGDITPGRFQRPYLTAGHASRTASGSGTRVPRSSHVPDPSQFDRGPLTAGHASPSPGNKSAGNNPTGSVDTGSARNLYASAAREATANAMKSVHDRLMADFPTLCPLAASKGVMPPDMGDTNVPKPVAPLATPKAPGEKAAKAAKRKDNTKKIVAKAVEKAVKATRTEYEARLAEITAQLDELGRQPDPTQAPVRGVVRTKAATSAEAVPVERRSLLAEAQEKAAKAERTHYIAYLQRIAASGDPSMREKAIAALESEGVRA